MLEDFVNNNLPFHAWEEFLPNVCAFNHAHFEISSNKEFATPASPTIY
jgi:hypothetical protein